MPGHELRQNEPTVRKALTVATGRFPALLVEIVVEV